MKILIIGGGIGGCAAAIALAARGHAVEVIEKQPEWRFQSSGIFVYSNGLESLERLGVLPEILEAGFAIPGGRNLYFDHRGAPIVETVYPSADGGRIPAILGIKRAELHRILTGRIAELGVPVRLGTEVAGIVQGAGGAAVTLSAGGAIEADLVVGADGLRSVTRALIGIDVAPRYTGFGVWRSVHTRPEGLRDKIMMMGPGKRFGIMPISDDRLYTFGTLVEPKEVYYDPACWPETMAGKFAEFGGPARAFLEELGPSSEVLYTAVEEVVLPLPWHRSRVVLIGDAAHASTPFMGQGGALAMQDALVLSEALEARSDVAAALEAFGRARFPLCQFVQDVSRAVGEAGATEDPARRDAELRETGQNKVDGFYRRVAELTAAGAAILLGR